MSALLDKVIALALWHALKKRESPDTWFTRMLHEQIKHEGLEEPDHALPSVRLTDAYVEVVQDEWSLSRLRTLWRPHRRKEPARRDKSLILFEGLGAVYLIDGATRVNLWEAKCDEGPHRVLIVKPRSSV